MEIFLLFLGMTIVTYIPRALPFVVMDKLKIGKKMQKFLKLIPYTAMTALIFPGILTSDPSDINVGLIGGIAAVFLSFFKKVPTAVITLSAILAVMIYYSMI